ncbi:MAG: hypothetical protein HYW63_00460 [Candidatus Levybacteria bacterium]|nr:hypothetical protein [Candidatus Levybacteria bacterium]
MELQRLREIFDTKASFAIVVGSGYSLDEMGGALALYLALSSLGKDVSVISSREPLVEVSNLVGIDKVKPYFESKSGDLVVSFPYQGDEIGKVSYTLESGLLNIIVKPKENSLSFGEKDVLFRRSGEVPQVLIAVGVKRLSELSAQFSIDRLKDTTIVNIDKFGNNEGFGDIVVIGQTASSISEQIANILVTLAYPMDPDISQNLMDGIVSATADFQSPQTSSLAFEMTGILLRNGAFRESVSPRTQPMTQRVSPQSFGYPSPPARPGMGRSVSPQAVQTPASQVARSSSPQSIREFPREQKKDDLPAGRQEAPPDWLSPKIYKGSTNVE